MTEMTLPGYNDIAATAERIADYANKTPMMTPQTVSKKFGAEVFFKCENFQRMGAFKFRGTMDALHQFTPQQRAAGVVTSSSGNHAQAIALSIKLLGIPATIIMPRDAPATKVAATKGYGGKVVTYDHYTEDHEKIGWGLTEKQGLTLIPPYDHPYVIAGQGTATKEPIEEVGQLDALFVCLGGGGLLPGSALAVRHLSPDCIIYGVEPEAGNDSQQSFRSGKIVHIDTPKTIADGAQTQHLGNYTFQITKQNVNDILTVSGAKLIVSMKFIAERMKIVVEPTGCLGFTATGACKAELRGKKIGIIISGGNVDISRYSEFLAG